MFVFVRVEMSYHRMPYHRMSYHRMSYHRTSYHRTSYHRMSYHRMSYHRTSYHRMSYHRGGGGVQRPSATGHTALLKLPDTDQFLPILPTPTPSQRYAEKICWVSGSVVSHPKRLMVSIVHLETPGKSTVTEHGPLVINCA